MGPLLHRLAHGVAIALGTLAVLACAQSSGPVSPWMMTTASTLSSDVGSDSAGGSDSSDAASGTPSESSQGPGETSGMQDTGNDATTDGDCAVPDPSPAWQLEHLEDVVAALSGESPIDGVMLSDRATAERRALVATWLIEQYGVLGIAAESHDYGSGTNVVATVPATMPSQGVLVLGAHYDSVAGAPGANDNATGVAVVTAAARYLDTVPCRTHDVLLVAFDQEEVGLLGSAAFAAKLVADRTPVISVHTIDQLGWDADGDRFIEIERPDAGLFEFYDDVLMELPAVGGLTVTDTGFTDHVSFRAAGFPAVGLTEEYVSGDTTPHYHLPSDTYDTVEFGFTTAASSMVNRAFATAIASP